MFVFAKSNAKVGQAAVVLMGLLLACQSLFSKQATAEDSASPESLTVLIMDPLSAPLACDCVQGYAQRNYELLGQYLQRELKKPVKVVWSASILQATKEHGEADIIIGKHSVVQFKAKKAKQKVRPIAQLSGRDGKVTQTGLIVVRKDDSAKSMTDLKGYRILFGPEQCDEKHSAILSLLETEGVERPSELEILGACSEAAAALMELDTDVDAAAVISSYAKPLLAGCGTIRKGDLRVVAESEPVPFITAFVKAEMSKQDRKAIQTALLDVELEPQLMIALETGDGFKKWSNPTAKDKKDKAGKKAATSDVSKKKLMQ